MLTWQSDERCVIGDLTFQILPVDLFEGGKPSVSMAGADFLLLKARPLVERYVELIEEMHPQHIFELGFFAGGSTALLLELARPRTMASIDLQPPDFAPLRDHVSRRNLDRVIRIYDGVDQADRSRLAEIAEDVFGDQPLDLVIDDCSHLYEATRASFNELFPRLRPGGLYLIEDWPWAHRRLGDADPAGDWPDQVPLTRLVFELQLAIPSLPGLISEVTTKADFVEVRRGDASVDPSGFDISACSNERGRRLLGDELAATTVSSPSDEPTG